MPGCIHCQEFFDNKQFMFFRDFWTQHKSKFK
ncbi:hypothetical protein BpHYR1_004452 [Brachionus plicatilis]|uniref:Uncharacterized protein n=1 Tax=Brachionus plicatilis TaxID=10195 RepID=A0A3M7P493_BRAPC|nr:hypothetical protein BpHYR1_004452 [Brachionus plicatilis]